MAVKGLSVKSRVLGMLAATLLATSSWAATNWNVRVLHKFGGGSDGSAPIAGLIRDGAGNFYGTTTFGGIYQDGTVFEVTPTAGGGWTESVLYNFGNGADDGLVPYGGLVLDGAGNLYGTTVVGGTFTGGTVFKLSPSGGGDWVETVLHNFGSGSDGANPYDALIFDATGNLYGTTFGGGTNYCSATGGGCGTIFELTPAVGGGWTEAVLHSFGSGTDGYAPYAGVILDAVGNLYGATTYGGAHDCQDAQYTGCGIVFELTPDGVGGWTETVVHDFEENGMDGAWPTAGLTIDGAGNLYGTTSEGGNSNDGIVFELTSIADGSWVETILHSFAGSPDAADPSSPLLMDAAGNLYGTSVYGGTVGIDWGTIFKLTRIGGGSWQESVLYSFCSESDCADGLAPVGSLVLDAAGNLYGTTEGGGTYQCEPLGCGTVFKLMKPVSPCATCSTTF